MPSVLVDDLEAYYEVHGIGDDGVAIDPVLVMGGWGTFTGTDFSEVPRGIVRGGSSGGRTVLVFDWRGLGRSADSADRPATTREHARVAAAVIDASLLNSTGTPLHVVGIVGMGACVAQWLAIDRPDLVRSLTISGGWARTDRMFTDQMESLGGVYESDGFLAFQRLSALWCFDPAFYLEYADRVLGPDGAWKHLDGRTDTMRRLVVATVTHDALDRLGDITAPTLVLHAGADLLTGPRLTEPIAAAIPGSRSHTWPDLPHVVAGREAKTRFSTLLDDFLTDVESHHPKV